MAKLKVCKMHHGSPLVLFLISTAVFGAIMYAATTLDDVCPRGSYCRDLARFPAAFKDRMGTSSTHLPPQADRPECANLPDTSNILLVMKTGASESYSRVPTQLLTNLRCLHDFLIFSDMEQLIAGHQIRDSLDTVLHEAKNDNQDFDLYRHQRKCAIDQESCNQSAAHTAAQGWALDKYKNIHIAEKTYALRPRHDWYLFVDADTYVVWSTLVDWLDQLNPHRKHYLGSVALLGGFPFAHGGSGYLVSQGAMEAMFASKKAVANQYDMAARSICCGDALFAKALKSETSLSVTNVWPTINGEKAHTLAYGPRQWCQPIVTMHHVDSEEVAQMDAFERERNFSSPLTFKDVYHRFVQDELSQKRDDWDNMSEDVHYVNTTGRGLPGLNENAIKTKDLSELEKKAHLSIRDCRTACKSVSDCVQWRYHQGVCSTSWTVKHGRPMKHDGSEDRWASGWDLDKIEYWVREHDACGNVAWPEV